MPVGAILGSCCPLAVVPGHSQPPDRAPARQGVGLHEPLASRCGLPAAGGGFPFFQRHLVPSAKNLARARQRHPICARQTRTHHIHHLVSHPESNDRNSICEFHPCARGVPCSALPCRPGRSIDVIMTARLLASTSTTKSLLEQALPLFVSLVRTSPPPISLKSRFGTSPEH